LRRKGSKIRQKANPVSDFSEAAQPTLAAGMRQYRSELRAAVRGLWSGALDEFDTWSMFEVAIRRSFTKAYNDGAQSVGTNPSELTGLERAERAGRIAAEMRFIDGFIEAIIRGSKANEGKLAPLFRRVDLWVQRYREVYNLGLETARDDPKYRWKINPEKENCVDCSRLAGQVRRLSVWKAHDLRPQSPKLACMRSARGVTVCGCEFETTTDPCTRGPLPRVE